jgi:hypothetical protein
MTDFAGRTRPGNDSALIVHRMIEEPRLHNGTGLGERPEACFW